MKTLISLKNISKKYPSTLALNGINLDFPETGMVFVKGKSGCGKTTLLNVLGGLDETTDGAILYDEQEINNYTGKQWDDYRNSQIGMIFQDYNLIDGLTVKQNIELVLDIQDELATEQQKHERIKEVLAFIDLKGFANRQVSELSGGQKQRVAIARVLAKQCRVILADEPTGNLDADSGKIVLSLLKKISEHRLVIIVTHDLPSALAFGDRLITITDGKVVDDIKLTNNASQELISISVSNETGKIIFNINDKNIKESKKELASWLVEQAADDARFDVQICRSNSLNKKEDKSQKKYSVKSVSTCILSWKTKLALAKVNLAQKKFRLVATTLMFSLTIFLLLISSFIMTYDRTETISKYLARQNIKEAYLFQNNSYTNKVFDTKINNIAKGEYYYNEVTNLFPSLNLSPRLRVDTILFESEDIFSGVAIASDIMMILSDNPKTYGSELLTGRYPINGAEIAITDYVAFSLLKCENIVGKNVVVDGITCKVVGIIKTDYEEKQIALKLKRNELNEFEQFDLQNIYAFAITTDNYREQMQATYNVLSLPSSNFFVSDMETRYLDSTVEFGSLNLLEAKDRKVFLGRLPKKANEVLISTSFAEQNQLQDNDFEKTAYFSFLDIYNPVYNNTFADTINLLEYFPNDIIVVGIYNSGSISKGYTPDVLVHDEVFTNLFQKYTSYYCFEDYAILVDTMEINALVKTADTNKLWFNEPAINKIYQFQNTLNNLSSIIIIVFSSIMLITIFMLSTYISNNIKVNTKKIGVLKAIGVSTKDISSIFLLEVILISLVSFLFSCAMTFAFTMFVNSNFIEQIKGHEFDYLYWNWKMTIPMFLLANILSIASAVVPLIRLAIKKPVEVIRQSQ